MALSSKLTAESLFDILASHVCMFGSNKLVLRPNLEQEFEVFAGDKIIFISGTDNGEQSHNSILDILRQVPDEALIEAPKQFCDMEFQLGFFGDEDNEFIEVINSSELSPLAPPTSKGNQTLTISNKSKCATIDGDIIKGFAVAIVDMSGNYSIGTLTDSDGEVAPELFKTKSQARKEAKQLRQEMNYSREDLRTCPAKWSKPHKTCRRVIKFHTTNYINSICKLLTFAV